MMKHTKYDNATVQALNGALTRENLPLRFWLKLACSAIKN